jgi:O-antigen/teichoic acid export membrane protein
MVAGVAVVAGTFPASTARVPTGVMLDQVRYGLPLGVTIAVSMLNRLVDKWYIAAFRSGDFGVYAIAAQEIPLLAVLPYAGGAALATGLVEAFRAGDVGLARSHWMSLTTSMTLVVVPVGVGLILIAPELMTAIFTPAFRPGVLPFQLFTLVCLHRVAEYGMLLRAAGRTRDVLTVAAWTLLSNAVLAGIGAWFGGMVGASAGTVVASGIGWWIALRRIARTFDVPVSKAFPWLTWCSVLAGSAVAAGAGQLVAGGTDHTATRVMLKLLTFCVAVVPVVSVARRLFDLKVVSVAADHGLRAAEAA